MTNDEAKGLSCIFTLMLSLVALPFYAALHGFTLATLWAWFAVPALGVKSIGILQAIGLTLIVHMLAMKYHKTDEDEDVLKETINRIVYAVVYCVLSLGEGWVVKKLLFG